MAAKFDAEEALRRVFDSDIEIESDQEEDDEEDVRETDSVGEGMARLEKLIDSFDGGEGFNSDLFRENAKKAIFPILCQSSAALQITGNIEKGM